MTTRKEEDLSGISILIERAREISGAVTRPVVVPIAGDGSDRKFFRITAGKASFVGLISPRTRKDSTDENDSYLFIGTHLHEKGLPAPRILYSDSAAGFFLLEDAGDTHLQKYALGNRPNLEKIYRRVIHLLACMHRRVPEGFSPDFCFDTQLYSPSFIFERELEYFRNSFLNGYLGWEIDEGYLRREFELLAETAGVTRMRHVFHRDFQSRNIMVHRNRLWVIDFQGMRFGPPAYDLASLLVDPYVRLPAGLQERMTGLYWSAAWRFLGCSRCQFLKTYTAVRLCRNLQILGAFGFLGIVKGKTQFLKYIPWSSMQLRGWLFNSCKGQYPRLERLVNRIEGDARLKMDKIW